MDGRKLIPGAARISAQAGARLTVRASETTQLIISAGIAPPGAKLVEAGAGDLSADRHGEIPLGVHFRLLRSLTESSADETLHLSMRRLAPGTTDFVIDTLANADNLEDVMKRVARGYNLVHGGYYNHVERRRHRLVYTIDDSKFPYAFDAQSNLSFVVMEGVMIFLHAMLCLAADEKLTPYLRCVRTRRPTRAPQDGLLSFWETPVRCGAHAYSLEYDIGAARLPLRSAERIPLKASAVYDMIDTLIADRERTVPRDDLATRVARAMAAGVTDQSDIADHLGVSVATLRRRLADLGLSFRDLRSQALNDKAIVMLRQGFEVGDVADALGFVDARSFSRAFKAWNGMTPTAFALKNRP
ncbi:MAG TPA: helix-turn-helix domain-containing protein, partial [Parvularculaceae bacterium]|nr:helix-turn-helix domain-containing protein [Parvularculaceae bacterium]